MDSDGDGIPDHLDDDDDNDGIPDHLGICAPLLKYSKRTQRRMNIANTTNLTSFFVSDLDDDGDGIPDDADSKFHHENISTSV